ncbi:MAG: hypothetical protein EOP49_28610 [Sphingobacteriales bacterium]|nr:MAG: hypothetical protein EOP49_28610 [Sphingobacteriales bacterium]
MPSVAVGSIWPPEGTQHLNVWGLPLVNTLLLLTSGLTITIAHAYILRDRDLLEGHLQLLVCWAVVRHSLLIHPLLCRILNRCLPGYPLLVCLEDLLKNLQFLNAQSPTLMKI